MRYAIINKFSSPLGDGLVQGDFSRDAPRSINFRPRVGMGWFKIIVGLIAGRHPLPVDEYIFDEPIEDVTNFDKIEDIFVPEWGWVGSCIQDNAIVCNKFSSPSGDRLVH